MDKRPIGVFDSGLGGLTAIRALIEVLPAENIIYLGDTGRVPYGSRSKETITKYAQEDISFLLGFDIKAVVAACGTVSTTALDDIAGNYPLPVFGVVNPAAAAAAAATKNGKIGVIGTEASIRSCAYNRAIQKILPDAEIFTRACPLLVPLIEAGKTDKGDILIESMISEYLEPMSRAGIDTLILGCTHYPIISGLISDYFDNSVKLISPGAEISHSLRQYLSDNGLLNESDAQGSRHYFVTDRVDGFSRLASLFLGHDVRSEAEQVNLEKS